MIGSDKDDHMHCFASDHHSIPTGILLKSSKSRIGLHSIFHRELNLYRLGHLYYYELWPSLKRRNFAEGYYLS